MSKDAVYEFVARADSDAEIGFALRGAVGMPAIVRVAAERGYTFTAGELAPVLDLLRFLADARRDAWLRGALASASSAGAVVALARARGYAFSSDELAHLEVGPASRALDDRDLDRVVGGAIAPESGLRMTTRLVPMQLATDSFGGQLAAGLAMSPAQGQAILHAVVTGPPPGSGGSAPSGGSDPF
jgi:predicted ribosomally synthesized peptide with nif11-like leader